MTKREIEDKYMLLHNALGRQKDAPDRELFDQKHRKIWADCNIELKQRKDELLNKPELSPEEKAELSELEDMFPRAVPRRNLEKEIDDLKEKIKELENKVGSP